MSTSKKALAAAAFLGLAGALLSPPALAIVSVGSEPVRSLQTLHPGIFLAEAEGKKEKAKAKPKAAKEKKPAAKAKAKAKGIARPPGGGGGSGDYQ